MKKIFVLFFVSLIASLAYSIETASAIEQQEMSIQTSERYSGGELVWDYQDLTTIKANSGFWINNNQGQGYLSYRGETHWTTSVKAYLKFDIKNIFYSDEGYLLATISTTGTIDLGSGPQPYNSQNGVLVITPTYIKYWFAQDDYFKIDKELS